ncbi:MAG: hypothetical protein Q9217_002805 [Psora testacea]
MDISIPHPASHRLDSCSESGASPVYGRVPRQQFLTSPNGTIGTSPRSLKTPHPNSAHYVKQCHSLLDHQLQAFAEERALWNLERRELHDRISQLEATLRHHQSSSSSRMSSPPEKNGSSRKGDIWGSIGTNGSRQSSTSSTGDEVWRGSNPDMRPTRTFSEALNPPLKAKERLPSIAENVKQHSAAEVPINPMAETIHKPTISGSEIDKNLDGINFKTSALPPEIIKSVMSSGSPSPLRSPTPNYLSPDTLRPPPSSLPALRDPNKDPYTMDAGHTPLAIHKYSTLVSSVSGPSSKAGTPTGPSPEQERPPLEPPTTVFKVPSERQDSYFPAVQPAESMEGDADPELKGPLGLTNEPSGDDKFLSELDTKLLQAAQTETYGSLPASKDGASDQSEEQAKDDANFEEPEHEPKLKIKRSMNFGTQFGASNCGKGI